MAAKHILSLAAPYCKQRANSSEGQWIWEPQDEKMEQVWGSIPLIGSAGLRVSKKPRPNLQVAVKGIPVQLPKEGHGIVQQELGQGRILQGPGERHGFLEAQVLTTFGLRKRKHKHDQPKRGGGNFEDVNTPARGTPLLGLPKEG